MKKIICRYLNSCKNFFEEYGIACCANVITFIIIYFGTPLGSFVRKDVTIICNIVLVYGINNIIERFVISSQKQYWSSELYINRFYNVLNKLIWVMAIVLSIGKGFEVKTIKENYVILININNALVIFQFSYSVSNIILHRIKKFLYKKEWDKRRYIKNINSIKYPKTIHNYEKRKSDKLNNKYIHNSSIQKYYGIYKKIFITDCKLKESLLRSLDTLYLKDRIQDAGLSFKESIAVFHLENYLYRITDLWNLLGQVLCEACCIKIENKKEINYLDIFNKELAPNGQVNSIVIEIKDYIQSKKHRDVIEIRDKLIDSNILKEEIVEFETKDSTQEIFKVLLEDYVKANNFIKSVLDMIIDGKFDT